MVTSVEPVASFERAVDGSAQLSPGVITPEDRQLSVWCGPHTKRGRYRVAVVTTGGQVVTDDGAWDLLRPSSPITAPCQRCIAPRQRYEAPRLDHRRLKSAIAQGVKEALLHDVVADPPTTTVVKRPPAS